MTALRKFGLELETYNEAVAYRQSGANIERAILGMGYPAKFQIHHHFATEYDKWQIKPDSTVGSETGRSAYGLEVVSPTLPGSQSSIDQVVRVANWLASNGYDVDRTCGYHIHIDAGDLTSYECAAVALRYHHRQNDIDSILPASRRGTRWAQRLNGANLNKVTNTVVRAETGERWSESERYVSVNLQHVAKGRSARRIEFRQHSGTLSAAKIIGWYKFLCEFVAETLAILRSNGGSVTPTTTTAPIIRRQRTTRGATRSVVVGTAPVISVPVIDVGTDYDLFLRFLASNGVVTQNDARTLGWPETRLRVTAHWLRRNGAELVTTQRNGELAYVGRNGATTREAIFTNPAQIRQRVSAVGGANTIHPAFVPTAAPARPSTSAQQEVLNRLSNAPLFQGMTEETKAWFNARRNSLVRA